jgi:hypothetical protein
MEEVIAAIKTAVKLMGGIPFFPLDEFARAGIIAGIIEFADSVEGIQWMTQQAVSRLKKWTGVPELRGIYCAGGFAPRDGRITDSSVMDEPSLPACYLPAPKLLPPLPMTEAEEAEMRAEMEELGRKIKESVARKRLASAVFDKKYKKPEEPEWLKNLQ